MQETADGLGWVKPAGEKIPESVKERNVRVKAIVLLGLMLAGRGCGRDLRSRPTIRKR